MNTQTEVATMDIAVMGDVEAMGLYAIVEQGSVTNTILWDGDTSSWSPQDGQDAIAIPDDIPVSIGWSYGADGFEAPPPPPIVPPTAAEIIAANTTHRNQLLAAAGSAIAPLQDADDLGESTADESALLTAWKQFRIAVNRIDLTLESPSWPTPPQSGYGAAVSPSTQGS